MRKLWKRYTGWALPTRFGLALGVLSIVLAVLFWLFPLGGDEISQTAGDDAVQVAGDLNVTLIDVRRELETYNEEEQAAGSNESEPSASLEPAASSEEPASQDERLHLSERVTPTSIFEALEPFDGSHRRTQAQALYHGKWLPESGWNLVVYGTPEYSETSSEWLVPLRFGPAAESVVVFAVSPDDGLSSWRRGDRVLLHGQVREVRLNPFIYVQHAELRIAD